MEYWGITVKAKELAKLFKNTVIVHLFLIFLEGKSSNLK
jgi:hypothetical protein